MDAAQFSGLAHQWANDILLWIGFGTLVGLAAKAVMPGRDAGGTVATLLMGIGGTVIGSGLLAFFGSGRRVTPLSPVGFLVATGGAFLLLFFHRLLSGSFFQESGTGRTRLSRLPRRRPVVVVSEPSDTAA
ncbi:MAG TPA: hypothetical protein VG013_26295 [Gemmataceae bacterium]|jgi:uncharacterized membrane protein YeaQ/YmgE (transglycosylase-associated protein family)|nr:hypothetical protein [Gemmataceae bacterium]